MVKKNDAVTTTKKIAVPTKVIVKAGGSQLKGFLDFLRTQGVIGLAVGLVLGSAVAVLVKSLVDNVVMPPIGLLLGSADGLKGLSLTIGHGNQGNPAIVEYGIFLNDFVNFLIIALVIYVVLKVLRVEQIDKKK